MTIAALFLAAACHLNVDARGVILPDRACTPGDTLNVAAVDICIKGYTKTVRKVSRATHEGIFEVYGIMAHRAGEYEVDHLISLELGGSNSAFNLWPQPASPRPGFRQKDLCENRAHALVCEGNLTLEQAQVGISVDWLTFCRSIGAVK